MKLSIERDAIVLDGEGGGVPIDEIRRVWRALNKLFGETLSVRVTGAFDGDAHRPVDGVEEAARATLDLMRTGTYHPVLVVGAQWLDVQVESGLNGGRAVGVDPGRGRGVRVRMRLR